MIALVWSTASYDVVRDRCDWKEVVLPRCVGLQVECDLLFPLDTRIMSVPVLSPLSAQRFSRCGQQSLGRCSWQGKSKRFLAASRSIRQPRAQTYDSNIGADADQYRSGSNDAFDDGDDDALHQQLPEEFPLELADDIDPEGRELTLEDLVTAQSGTAQSLRDELHAGDVWGPPVSCSALEVASALCHRSRVHTLLKLA